MAILEKIFTALSFDNNNERRAVTKQYCNSKLYNAIYSYRSIQLRASDTAVLPTISCI